MAAAGLLPDHHPTADFFLCDIFDAAPKDDMGSMEHPMFSLATRPDRRVLSYEHNGVAIKQLMRENVARLLRTDVSRVGVKARTHEKVDSVGKARALECHVVLTMQRKEFLG